MTRNFMIVLVCILAGCAPQNEEPVNVPQPAPFDQVIFRELTSACLEFYVVPLCDGVGLRHRKIEFMDIEYLSGVLIDLPMSRKLINRVSQRTTETLQKIPQIAEYCTDKPMTYKNLRSGILFSRCLESQDYAEKYVAAVLLNSEGAVYYKYNFKEDRFEPLHRESLQEFNDELEREVCKDSIEFKHPEMEHLMSFPFHKHYLCEYGIKFTQAKELKNYSNQRISLCAVDLENPTESDELIKTFILEK